VIRARRLQVFAVEPDAVQLSWGALGPGEVTVRCGDLAITIDADGGPGTLDLVDLAPDTDHVIDVGGHRLTAHTLAPPPGDELFRFMTLSDLHLGQHDFGLLNTMREKDPEEPHTLRCSRAAATDGVAWGAEHLVLKGDLVNRGTSAEYDLVAKVLAGAGLPADAVPGNHEVKPYREIDPVEGFLQAGLPAPEPIRALDLPGLRVALVDSTILGTNKPQLDRATKRMAEVLDGRPAMVVLHHHLLRAPFPIVWPPGVPSGEANRFVRAVADASPAALVVSGHTHRHRLRRRGHVHIAETGSPKDYPGTWTGYVVHEGGLRQVVRRVSHPDTHGWLEYSRLAALGLWQHHSPGLLSHRNFTLTWP
jgi:Calcineurin-like phosphoesterase superfamily domain